MDLLVGFEADFWAWLVDFGGGGFVRRRSVCIRPADFPSDFFGGFFLYFVTKNPPEKSTKIFATAPLEIPKQARFKPRMLIGQEIVYSKARRQAEKILKEKDGTTKFIASLVEGRQKKTKNPQKIASVETAPELLASRDVIIPSQFQLFAIRSCRGFFTSGDSCRVPIVSSRTAKHVTCLKRHITPGTKPAHAGKYSGGINFCIDSETPVCS